MAVTQSYSVDNKTVSEMLGSGSLVYSIPDFQRKYAWTNKEVGELLYDLFDDVDWTSDEPEDILPHFLGSIVVANSEKSELVLDGQQRLATVSLLLALLRLKLQEQSSTKADIINPFLVKISTSLKEADQIKLKLQAEDAEAYSSLIRNPSSAKAPELKSSLLARAMQKITADVEDKYLCAAREAGTSIEEALLLMLDRVINQTTFVKIVAPSESDAFRLFETLNDRGLALNAADLVKNKILAKCSESKNLDEAVEAWRNIVELVGEDEIVNFLRYYWIAFHGNVRKKDLYKVFEGHLGKLAGQQALNFTKNLRRTARDYAKIVNPGHEKSGWNAETRTVLERLLMYAAKACRPVLLACANRKPSCMLIVAKACESITVRHSVVSDLSSNELEKSYAKLARSIVEDQDVAEAVVRELSKHALKDEDFARNFSNLRISSKTNVWRQVLIQLNSKISTGETTIRDAMSVHMEHILPRNPSKRALEEAFLDKESADELSRMIGNLTLISGTMNRSMSNREFLAKRPDFEASEIALNKEIAQKSSWGRKEILERNERLGQLAIEVWSWPVS